MWRKLQKTLIHFHWVWLDSSLFGEEMRLSVWSIQEAGTTPAANKMHFQFFQTTEFRIERLFLATEVRFTLLGKETQIIPCLVSETGVHAGVRKILEKRGTLLPQFGVSTNHLCWHTDVFWRVALDFASVEGSHVLWLKYFRCLFDLIDRCLVFFCHPHACFCVQIKSTSPFYANCLSFRGSFCASTEGKGIVFRATLTTWRHFSTDNHSHQVPLKNLRLDSTFQFVAWESMLVSLRTTQEPLVWVV